MSRQGQRGSAMLVTMVIIAALLAGAAVLASMQVNSNRSTELTRNGLGSLYCAEHGLTAARQHVINGYGFWQAALAGNCADSDCATLVEPAFLSSTAFSHDVDGGTTSNDFAIYIRDNDDDATGPQILSADSDDTIFIVSRCTKYPDTPKQVEELIKYTPAMNPYCAQEAGANSRNNDNDCN
jgi:type II secretory pathway pseudopilin PulG